MNKAASASGEHGRLTWGAAQAGVAAGVADAAVELALDDAEADRVLLIAAVWVDPNAADADLVFVLARTEQGNRAGGLSMFAVAKDNPGMIAREVPMLGTFKTHQLTFADCEVDDLALIGLEGSGFKSAQHTLSLARIDIGARALAISGRCIEMMIEHGTFLVPTLVAPLGVLESVEQGNAAPEYALRKARESVGAHKDSIARAYKAGVKIAMGTDAAVVPHGTNLRELGLMCDAGMSPMESLVATTKVAAECLGWQDRVGTLEAGKYADVVITRTDPLADIRSLEDTNNIAFVMKGGEIVKDIRSA